MNCVTMTFVQVFIIHVDSTMTGIYDDSTITGIYDDRTTYDDSTMMTVLLNKILFQEEKQGTGALNAGT